jgi:transcription elongation factor GreA
MVPRPNRALLVRRRSFGLDVPRSYRREDEMVDTVITQDGFARLTEELERLTTDGRRAMAERLEHAAAGEANRLENADFLGALEDQALLEQRIALLADRLGSARVVEPRPGNGRLEIGERVRVQDVESGERLDLQLVGPLETDAAAGKISVLSPLGKAVVGRRGGAIVEIDAPRGTRRFKVLAVETRAPDARTTRLAAPDLRLAGSRSPRGTRRLKVDTLPAG